MLPGVSSTNGYAGYSDGGERVTDHALDEKMTSDYVCVLVPAGRFGAL